MQTLHSSGIESRVLEIFSGRLHTEVPSVDTDLLESGILDSLKFVELLLALESELAIKLSLEELELENFRSVQQISSFISGRGHWNGHSG